MPASLLGLLTVMIVIVVVAVYLVSHYNGLINVRHQVDQAWANIDVLLKQRHDELPNLVEVVRSHAGYERELLEKLTALRARTGSGAPDAERLAAEQALSQGIGRLLATAEAYPQLAASAAFLELQKRIGAIEDQITHRREFYNAAVNLNNARMEQLPERLMAGLARMQRRELFRAAEAERAVVDMGALLSR